MFIKNKNQIKTISGISLMILSLVFVFAYQAQAAPDKFIYYQGKLTNTSDVAVSDGSYNFTFTLWDAASGGSCVWSARGTCGSPTAKSVSVANGIFNTALGDAQDNAMSLDFNSNYYLQVKVGTDSNMDTRKQIGGAGFALNSLKLNGQDASYYLDLANATGDTDDITEGSTNLYSQWDNVTGGINYAGGNVGIGTTTPDKLLNIIGSGGETEMAIDNTGTTSDPATRFRVGGLTKAIIGIDNSDGDKFKIAPANLGTSDWLTIDGGNVGIGTTSPTALLDIKGSSSAYNYARLTTDATNDYGSGIQFADGGGIEGTIIYQHFYDRLAFNVGSTGIADPEMVIKEGGNVGIGTTSPNAKLDIKTTADESINVLVQNDDTRTYLTANYNGYSKLESNNDLVFATGNSYTEQVRILESGNVGIGTTNPSNTKLQVVRSTNGAVITATGVSGSDNTLMLIDGEDAGTTDSQPLVRLKRTSSGTTAAGFGSALEFFLEDFAGNEDRLAAKIVGQYDSGSGNYPGALGFWTRAAGNGAITERMRIDSSGNIGIGTTTPGAKLEIYGATNQLRLSYDGSNYGDISTSINGSMLLAPSNNYVFAGTRLLTGSNDSSYGLIGAYGGGTSVVNGGMLNLYTSADYDTTYDHYGFKTYEDDLYIGREGGGDIVLKDSGNVGVGTTTPTAKLEVAGTLKATTINASTSFQSNLYWGNDDFEARLIGSGIFKVTTGGTTEHFRIDSSGNVGIGTTTPGATLHVLSNGLINGDDYYNMIVGDTSDYATSVGGGISFRGKYNTAGSYADFGSIQGLKENSTDGNYASALRFTTRANGGDPTEAMRISSGGNVGIGTTTPTAELEVNGTMKTGGPSGALSSGDIGLSNDANIRFGDNTNSNWHVAMTYDSSEVLKIGRLSTLNIKSNNVGIGTNNPGALLEIGDGTADKGIIINAADAGQSSIQFESAGTQKWNLFRAPTTNNLQFYANGGASTNVFTLQHSSGNVGIGLTNPVALLNLYGGSANAGGGIKFHTADTGLTSTDGSTIFVELNTMDLILRNYENSDMIFRTNDTEAMRIESSGNVGIGTTVPSQKLEVVGAGLLSSTGTTNYLQIKAAGTQTNVIAAADSGPSLSLQNTSATNSNYSGIVFMNSGGAYSARIVGVNKDHATNAGEIALATRPASGTLTEIMRITSGGNVGIGTTVPAQLLHIKSSSGSGAMRIEESGGQKFDLYSTNSGDFRIYDASDGAYRLAIDTSGNVGIGTTTPSQKFHIISASGNDFWVQKEGTSVIGQINPSSTAVEMGAYSNNPLYLTVNNDEKMVIDTTGNVGIGTTAPSSKLHIYGADQALTVEDDAAYDANPAPGIRFYGKYSSAGAVAQWASIQSPRETATSGEYGGELAFLTRTNGSVSAEAMRIDGSGNVGIGTTSPNYQADIVSTSSGATASLLQLRNNATATGTGAQIRLSSTTDASGSYGLTTLTSTRDAAGISTFIIGVSSNAGNTISDVLTIAGNSGSADGNVGIGTTSPSTTLEVSGTTNVLDLTSDGTNINMNFKNTEQNWQIGRNTAVDGFYFYDDDYRMVIKDGGNVGIGTTTPSGLLDVAGSNGSVIVTTSGQEIKMTRPDVNYIYASDASGSLRLGAGANASYVAIANDGNVGIGTMSPSGIFHTQKLATDADHIMDVYSDNNGNVARLKFRRSLSDTVAYAANSTGSYLGSMEFYGVNSGSSAWGRAAEIRITQDGSAGATYVPGKISFLTSDGSSNQAERLIINKSGNVGVGVAPSGAATMDIQSDSGGDALYIHGRDNGTVDEAGITFRNYGNGVSHGSILGYSSKLRVQGGSAGLELFEDGGNGIFVQDGGNVGIGTTSPIQQFHLQNNSNGGVLLFERQDSSTSGNMGQIQFGSRNYDDELVAIRAIMDGATDAGYLSIFTEPTTGSLTERMRITSGGNVGIGTTNPGTARLKVVQNVGYETAYFSNSSDYGYGVYIVGGGTAGGTEKRYILSLNDYNNVNRMTVQQDGNVGIGTTTPGAKVQIDGSYDAQLLKVRYSDTVNGGVGLDSSGTYYGLSWFYNGNKILTADSNYGFLVGQNYQANDAPANGMIIEGNVGIGTTTPSTKLEISASGEVTSKIVSTGGTYKPQLILQRGTAVDDYVDWKAYSSAANFFIDSSRESVDTNRFFINYNTGNTGIGTTSPNYKLEVNGSFNATSIYLNGTALATATAGTVTGQTLSWNGSSWAASSNLFNDGTNVGIGTTTPNYKLEIDGTTDFGNTATWGNGAQGMISWGSDGFTVSGSGSNKLSLAAAGGSNHLVINSSGNVGIGTTTPDYKLSVASSGASTHNQMSLDAYTATDGYESQLFLRKSLSNTLGTKTDTIDGSELGTIAFQGVDNTQAFDFGARIKAVQNGAAGTKLPTDLFLTTYSASGENTAQLVLHNGGNVGIGTTNPSAKLNISDTATQLKLSYTGGSASTFETKSSGDLNIDSASNIYLQAYSGTNSTIVGTTGYLLVNSSGNSSFTGSGNVGIGTTTPQTTLNVNGTTALGVSNWPTTDYGKTGTRTIMGGSDEGMVLIWNQSTTAESEARLRIGQATTVSGTVIKGGEIRGGWEGTGNLGYLSFYTIPSSNVQTERMRIDSSGNVGIGMTSPENKVDIQGDATYLSVRASDGSKSVQLGSDSTGDGQLRLYDQDGVTKIFFYAESGSDNYITNGNLGIGTTTPGTALDVVGSSIRTYLSSSSGTGVLVLGNNSLSNGSSILGFYGSNSATNWRIRQNDVVAGDLTFTPSTVAGGTTFTTPAMVLSNGSNVGIGTTTPTYKLDVAGNTRTTGYPRFVIENNEALMSLYGAGTSGDGGRINSYASTGTVSSPTLMATGRPTFGTVGYGYDGDQYLTNAYMYFYTEGTPADDVMAGRIVFATNAGGTSATERMRITSEGKVGIGTTAPASDLVVVGNSASYSINNGVRFMARNTVLEERFLFEVGGSGNNSILHMYDASEVEKIKLNSGTNQDSYINSGNVGIGTTTPSEVLQVVGYIKGQEDAELKFKSDRSAYFVIDADDGETDRAFSFYHTSASSGNELFRIQENGNIGIGTTTPGLTGFQKSLTLYAGSGTAQRAAIEINGSQENTGQSIGDFNVWNKGVNVSRMLTVRGSADNTGHLTFYTTNAGSSSEKMRIQADGSVGIGTTTPSAKLEIWNDLDTAYDSVTYTSAFPLNVIDTGTGNHSLMHFRAHNTFSDVILGVSGDGTTNRGSFVVQTDNDGSLAERFRVNYDGNVGIGTTTPSRELEVYGSGTMMRLQSSGLSPGAEMYDSNNKILAFGMDGSANGYYGMQTENALNLITNNQNRLYISSSGRVAIGGTSPNARLTLQYGAGGGTAPTSISTSNAYLDIGGDEYNTGSYRLISFGYQQSYFPAYMGFYETTAAGSTMGDLIFGTRGSTDNIAPSERMRITGAGNVGIGTTAPATLLEIQGSEPAFTIDDIRSDDPTAWKIASAWRSSPRSLTALEIGDGSSVFQTITSAGNIGIGTTNPTNRLAVQTSTNGDGMTLLDGSGNEVFYARYSSGNNGGWLSLNQGGASKVYLRGYGDSWFNAGNVGIGSTAPSAKLYVDQTAAADIIEFLDGGTSTFKIADGGAITMNGSITYNSSTKPKRSIILTSAGATIPTSDGATQTKVDGTNHTFYVLDFNDSTDNSSFWHWTMPDSFDGGTIDVTFYWEAAVTTGNVVWAAQTAGVAADSTEDIDPTLGSAQTATDAAQGNANDLGAATISSWNPSWAAGDYIVFKAYRDADAGTDTMSGDARLVKVKIEYSVDSESD